MSGFVREPGAMMSGYLHGGGVPYIADTTVEEIARDAEEHKNLAFLSYAATLPDQGSGENRHQIQVKSVDPANGFSQQFVAVLSPEARRSLGRGQPDEGQSQALEVDAPTADRATRLARKDPRFYYRIVASSKKSGTDGEPAVRALAAAMRRAQGKQQGRTAIPAAYTYLGQFIAHDMTHLSEASDRHHLINLRSHALRLDSLFGPATRNVEAEGKFMCGGGLCLGQTNKSVSEAGREYSDLPRGVDGAPCIPDARNDNNLAVSQLTVAFIKFHQLVCRLTDGSDPEEQRNITRQHFHSMVLHDYLNRISDPAVYTDVVENGNRRVIFCTGVPPLFLVPIEFAAACFRFGHTMVRASYDWSQYQMNTDAYFIRRISHLGAVRGKDASITSNWIVDWNFLLDRARTSDDRQFAAPIAGKLAGDLASLDDAWIDKDILGRLTRPNLDLAEITLLRGCDVELASGQDLAHHVGSCAKSPGDVPLVPSETMFDGLLIDRGSEEGELIEKLRDGTPLWFYCLREAESFGNAGQHLGPMASRIVLETVHAAVASSPGNIIGDKSFRVLKGLNTGSDSFIRLDELLRLVQSQDLAQ